MKKKLFACVAAVLTLLSACQKAEEVALSPDGTTTTVSFTADLDQALKTRAVAGETNGTQATTLTVAVYNASNQEIAAIRQVKANAFDANLQTTVSFQLVKGQTYSFAFWAQNPGATTGAVVFEPSTGKVSVDYTKIKANDETLDAFTAHVNNLTVSGPVSKNITLLRPWAQLNYGATTADVKGASLAGIEITKSKVVVNNVYKTLNLLDGTVADETTANVELVAANIPTAQNRFDVVVDNAATPTTKKYGKLHVDNNDGDANNDDYVYIGLNYLLVGGEADPQSLIKADLEVYQGDTRVNAIAFSNVPVQRNYRTNIVGNLLTSQVEFQTIIDPLYVDDINKDTGNGQVKHTVNVATGEELVAALTGSTEFKKYGIITLTDDIDMTGLTAKFSLNGYTGEFKNLTFDGDGHKIKNLSTPLFSGTWAGSTQLTIKGVTIEDANITGTADHPGTGIFICGISATESVIFDDCHIRNSTLSSTHYGGGFFTYADGYNNPNDGPVFQTVIIRNCSVEGCTLSAKKSVAAICGHATGNAWTKIQIENTKILNNTITNTDNNRRDIVGAVVGTIGVAGTENNGKTGGTYLTGLTVTGNTVNYTNSGVTTNLGNNHWIGRVGSDGGKMWIDGVLRAERTSNTEYFYKADGTSADVNTFIE